MKVKRWITVCALAAAMAMNAGAEKKGNIVMDGSTTVGPIAKAFAEYYMGKYPGVNISVSESGSGNGAKSIINGTADIGNMSCAMKDSELEAAKSKGVKVMEHIVAMDGIAIVVHPGNPVAALTVEQLRKIYTGEIGNWSQLGGPNKPVVVISRDTNSGTYETFETLVMHSERMTDKTEYVGSNGAIRQRVMTTDGAIGYVGLAFTHGLKVVDIDGVTPTPESVLDKSYPIGRPLYMYTNGEPAEGTVLAEFLGLYKTSDGKKIIEEQGFIPMP